MFANCRFHKNIGHHRKKVHSGGDKSNNMSKINVKIRHISNISVVNYLIYVSILLILVQPQFVHLQQIKIVNIDCGASEHLNEGSCAIIEPLEIKDDDFCDFINVPNLTKIIHLKFATRSNLTKIPGEIFVKLPNLQYLDLAIGLHALPTNRLFSDKKIKSIVLADNFIQTISHEIFSSATQLEEINLRNNRIATIEDNAFSELDKLETLILTGNRVTIINRHTFSGLSNLKNLDISDNAIDTIEDDALMLPALEEFLCSRNKLKILPDRIFQGAPNLLNIDFRENVLEKIGHAFSVMHKLNQLQLSNNDKLTDLNVLGFTKMASLISLELENVGLRTISGVAHSNDSNVTGGSNRVPLTTLNLKNNHLSEVDFLRRMSIFGKLEKLFVDKNKFNRWQNEDVARIKALFPNIELIVTKNNIWDKKWVEETLVPVFKTNHIYCNQIKYLGVYIFGFKKGNSDHQMVDATECV